MASRNDYDKAALFLIATDRRLAQSLRAACRKYRPVRPELVLLEAALSDALTATHVTQEEADAGRLIEQARPRSQRRSSGK